jgi:hypothetical protein
LISIDLIDLILFQVLVPRLLVEILVLNLQPLGQ